MRLLAVFLGVKKIILLFAKVLLDFMEGMWYTHSRTTYPGVAQIGSALEWGSRGRRFDSCHSDQYSLRLIQNESTLIFCIFFL